jgi:hypothetical protein
MAARISDPMLDRLEALPPPEGHEEQARRFVALIRKAQPLLKDSARALREDDRQAAQQANDAILDAAIPARALARKLNIERCIPPGTG